MFLRFLNIALGNLLRQAITVFVQVIVARRLGDAAFGLLTFAFSIYLLMAGVADFGSRLYCWQAVAALPMEARGAAAHELVWKRLVLALTIAVLINLGIGLIKDPAVAWLLRAYSIAVAFNQVAFDWWFLSQDRTRSLLIFNVAGALLLLVGTLAFVHGPNDVAVFALILSFAYGLPGVAMTMLGRPLPSWRVVAEAVRLPFLTRKYVGYDWFQRIYQAFIPVIAWNFYDKAALGQFRVAYLFYWFAGTLAIYVGSSIFNRLVRSAIHGDEKIALGAVASLLLLIVVPLSGAATVLAPLLVDDVLGPTYAASHVHLGLLLPWLVVPVIANFLREAIMASGQPNRAMWSYVVTVVATSAGIALFNAHGAMILSAATVIGEVLGVLPVLGGVGESISHGSLRWRLPIALASYALIVAAGRSGWMAPDFWPPYVALAVNGVVLTSMAGVIIAMTLLAEQQLTRSR